MTLLERYLNRDLQATLETPDGEDVDLMKDERFLMNLESAIFVNIQNIYDYTESRVNLGDPPSDTEYVGVIPPFQSVWLEDDQSAKFVVSYEEDGLILCTAWRFTDWDGFGPDRLTSMYQFVTDKEGHFQRIYFYEKKNRVEFFRKVPRLADMTEDQLLSTISELWFMNIAMTFTFMNCKNVPLVLDFDPTPRMQRKAAKRGEHPFVKQYTLRIDALADIIKAQTKGPKTDIRHAFHICRGHFKKFDEKPLFGKFKGTYWWPQMVRGSKEIGVIEKDYQVQV